MNNRNTVLSAGILLLTCQAALASTFFVATNGSDQNPGTQAKPFITVQKGLDMARAGDTVRVKPGLYRCRVQFKNGGEASQPVTLEGETGAVIDGGEVPTDWEPAPEIGAGIFKTTSIKYLPRLATWNGRVILVLRPDASAYQSGGRDIRNELLTPATNNGGVGSDRWRMDDWWAGIEAICTRLDGAVYFRTRQGVNPQHETIAFAPEGSAAILAEGKNFLVIRGLAIRNATYGISLSGANDCVVENNYLSASGKCNILLVNGASRNHIRANECTQNYIYADFGHPWRTPLDNRIWGAIKARSYGDEMGIRLENHGDDNQIYANHIFRHFDGINQKPSRNGGRRTKIFNNILQNIGDDALAPEGNEIEAEWHDNAVIEGGNGAMTISPGNSLVGPLYIYRNRCFFTQLTNTGDSLHFKNPFPATARLFCYHNTSVGNYDSVSINGLWSNRPPVQGVLFFNNIYSGATFYGDRNNPPQYGVGFFDYNWCGGKGAGYLAGKPNFGSHNIIAPGESLWPDRTKPSFFLSADSAARGKGIDASKPFQLFNQQFPAMPGLKPGYFTGQAPDLGILQYGQKPPLPAAPSDLAGTMVEGKRKLAWKDNSDNETGFLIDRSTDGSVFTTIARVAANTTTFVDDASGDTRCWYRVWAINLKDGAWYSEYSTPSTHF